MPTVSQINAFVGLPYEADGFDCADLAILIQRELFGKVITMGRRPKGARTVSSFIARQAQELATPISFDDAVDGDAVLIIEDGAPQHVGTLFFIGGVAWVLHGSVSIGFSLLQRLSDLPAYRLKVEGFYRWK